mgnify:FL=1
MTCSTLALNLHLDRGHSAHQRRGGAPEIARPVHHGDGSVCDAEQACRDLLVSPAKNLKALLTLLINCAVGTLKLMSCSSVGSSGAPRRYSWPVGNTELTKRLHSFNSKRLSEFGLCKFDELLEDRRAHV